MTEKPAVLAPRNPRLANYNPFRCADGHEHFQRFCAACRMVRFKTSREVAEVVDSVLGRNPLEES